MSTEEFFASAPKRQADPDETEIKNATDKCQLFLHDEGENGVVIDVENKESKDMHIRLDFGECENLIMTVNEKNGVMKVDDTRCAFDCKAGEFKRVIHLDVENLDLGSYELKYKLMGFFRNASGELVDSKTGKALDEDKAAGGTSGGSAGGASGGGDAAAAAPAKPAAAAPAGGAVSGSASKSGAPGAATSSGAAGGGGGGQAGDGDVENAFPECEEEVEVEYKKINDHLQLELVHYPGSGYVIYAVAGDKAPGSMVTLDASSSENLAQELEQGQDAGADDDADLAVAGRKIAMCKLSMADENEEGYGLSYKVSAKLDSSGGSGAASGELSKKGSGDADKKAAEEAAAKKKAEQEAAAAAAAKKKADDEEAAKKAADEARIAGELARKKKAEEDAAKKAADEDKKKNAKEAAAEEQRKKMAAMQAAKEKAEKDAAAAKEREEKAAAEKEAAEKRWKDLEEKEDALYGELNKRKLTPFQQKEEDQAEKEAEAEAKEFIGECIKKDPTKKMAAQQEQLQKQWKLYAFIKRRYEIEWRLRFMLIEKMFYEKVCALCRNLIASGEDPKVYKEKTGKTHKCHQSCFDKAPKCDMCNDVLIGSYTMTKGDNPTKLHNGECLTAYKNKSRPTCCECGGKILDDKWTTVGTSHYHEKCKK